jgi:hypothetical protein
MGFCNLIAAGTALIVYMVLSPGEAWAWGPATHVQLANEVLSHLALIPASVAGILSRYAADFVFGNLAADVVFAKKRTRVKQVCHRWATGLTLLRKARSDSGRSFAYGYLSHLSADTVAHNKFIPRQVVMRRSTKNFGHVYWELRADLCVEPRTWKELRSFVGRRFPEHEAHMATCLTGTLLPFERNLHLFHRLNGLVSRRGFRTGITVWDRLSRYELCDRMVADYRCEALDRIYSVLTEGPESAVFREDPNGNHALSMIRVHQRESRALAWLGLPVSGRLAELMEMQAPRPKPRPLFPMGDGAGGGMTIGCPVFHVRGKDETYSEQVGFARERYIA